jgi:hypothetical protein
MAAATTATVATVPESSWAGSPPASRHPRRASCFEYHLMISSGVALVTSSTTRPAGTGWQVGFEVDIQSWPQPPGELTDTGSKL